MEIFQLPFPIDFIIIAVIFIVAALYALKLGVGRVTALTLSIPVALFAYQLAFSSAYLGNILAGLGKDPWIDSAFFVALVIAVYLVIGRLVRGNLMTGEPVQSVLVGGAFTAMVLMGFHVLPSLAAVWTFAPEIAFFFTPGYHFFILLGTFAVLFAAYRA